MTRREFDKQFGRTNPGRACRRVLLKYPGLTPRPSLVRTFDLGFFFGYQAGRLEGRNKERKGL